MRIITTAIFLMSTFSVHAYEFSFNGFVKAEVVNSDNGVGSYGNSYSHVAVTRALRRDRTASGVASDQEQKFLRSDATSIQTAQTRMIFNVRHDKVHGVMEFDFIDGEDGFTNQTAIQSQEARIRLATLYYDITDKLTVFGGQKWGTAGGIKGIGSYNFVGNGFQAGNTAFLAEEFGLTYKNSGLSATAAITGKGRNAGVGVNSNELGMEPGLAIDLRYKTAGNIMFGTAFHGAKLNFNQESSFTEGENSSAYLAKVFASLPFLSKFTLMAEYYTGQSVNNLNALGVAPAQSINSGVVSIGFKETGFWTTLKVKATEKDSFTLGYGQAEVDSGQVRNLTALQMSANSYLFGNYGRALSKNVTAFLQLTQHNTDWGSEEANFKALATQSGLLYRF